MSENNRSEIQVNWDTIAKLEALLFVSPGPTSINQLATSLQISEERTIYLLSELDDHYKKQHGIRLQCINNKYQLTSASENSQLVESFLGLEVTSRLTQPALEALAIIAYNQPTTRPEVDGIRGVNSDGVIKSLLTKGLIEELGRSEAPGRPILYGVTSEFLQHFGLDSLQQLPPVNLEEITKHSKENGTDRRILKG
jgi:segregation and condensation protein B